MRVEGAGSDWSALRDGTTTRSNGRVERESEHLTEREVSTYQGET
jgi:hypothetical protein